MSLFSACLKLCNLLVLQEYIFALLLTSSFRCQGASQGTEYLSLCRERQQVLPITWNLVWCSQESVLILLVQLWHKQGSNQVWMQRGAGMFQGEKSTSEPQTSFPLINIFIVLCHFRGQRRTLFPSKRLWNEWWQIQIDWSNTRNFHLSLNVLVHWEQSDMHTHY